MYQRVLQQLFQCHLGYLELAHAVERLSCLQAVKVACQEVHAHLKHSGYGAGDVLAVAVFQSSHVVAEERDGLDDERRLVHLRSLAEEEQSAECQPSVVGHDLEVFQQLVYGHAEVVGAFAIALLQVVVECVHVDVCQTCAVYAVLVGMVSARLLEHGEYLVVFHDAPFVAALLHPDVAAGVFVGFVDAFVDVYGEYGFAVYEYCLGLYVDGGPHVVVGCIAYLAAGVLYFFVVESFYLACLVFHAYEYGAAVVVGKCYYLGCYFVGLV